MSKKALLGGLLPFISNPVVLAAVGIGAIGWTVYDIFSNKEDDRANSSETVPNGSTPLIEPLKSESLTVAATVSEPFETVEVTVEGTDNPAVEEPHVSRNFDDLNIDPQQNGTINEENLKKEMIRQAMSELGKRSAAARAKKKILA